MHLNQILVGLKGKNALYFLDKIGKLRPQW